MPWARRVAQMPSRTLAGRAKPWASMAAVWGEPSARNDWMAFCIEWVEAQIRRSIVLGPRGHANQILRDHAQETRQRAWGMSVFHREMYLRRLSTLLERDPAACSEHLQDGSAAIRGARDRMSRDARGLGVMSRPEYLEAGPRSFSSWASSPRHEAPGDAGTSEPLQQETPGGRLGLAGATRRRRGRARNALSRRSRRWPVFHTARWSRAC